MGEYLRVSARQILTQFVTLSNKKSKHKLRKGILLPIEHQFIWARDIRGLTNIFRLICLSINRTETGNMAAAKIFCTFVIVPL